MSKGGKEDQVKNKRRNFKDDNEKWIKETGWVRERQKFQMGKIQLYLLKRNLFQWINWFLKATFPRTVIKHDQHLFVFLSF